MQKEISKGTQKFIWHMVSFVAVFIIALVILCRVLPEPNRTASADPNSQVSTSQTDENISTDFDSVKERVDRANNTTGKEIKSLYTGDGKSSMQKQLETRLFFNTIKNILICVLLAVVIIVLLKKGFSLKKIKKILDEDDEPSDSTPATATPTETERKDKPKKGEPENGSEPTESKSADEEEEPPIVDPKEPDEQEVAEKCKL